MRFSCVWCVFFFICESVRKHNNTTKNAVFSTNKKTVVCSHFFGLLVESKFGVDVRG